uniref:Uncharacterized protein n=1 Tax=Rhizophora mucronata TaxID=61149 RepID=A0A2P2QTQ4_RHIMU
MLIIIIIILSVCFKFIVETKGYALIYVKPLHPH